MTNENNLGDFLKEFKEESQKDRHTDLGGKFGRIYERSSWEIFEKLLGVIFRRIPGEARKEIFEKF